MNDETNEFKAFPKMARLSREAIISEKIDGTNGCVFINESGELRVGSRNRWVTTDDDNYGFARWVEGNKQELLKLGPGWHRGEWWGNGIQRGYGLSKGDKRFSLFNTIRWCRHGETPQLIQSGDPTAEPKYQDVLPACVGLVPVLHRGIFSTREVDNALFTLFMHGSMAAPGYQKPEGVVVHHTAANINFKKTIAEDCGKHSV